MKQKTISILIKDFKDNVYELINSSELPPCIINEIFINVARDVATASKQQYENEFNAYENASEVENGED